MAGPPRVDAARERVLAEHRDVLEATVDAADAVAADPGVLEATVDAADAVAADPGALAEGATLRRRLRERLAGRDLLARYPGVLRTAVAAAGCDLAADPVPAPPYVVVTSTGPLLRGSTATGRLLVAVRTFSVRRNKNIEHDTELRYRRTGASVADAVDIRHV
jgi:hypothetical protein